VNISFEDAQKACSAQGKHLCTTQEWQAACSSEKNEYPYGKKFEKDQCNTIGNVYVKNKIAPSGEFAKCAGSSGVVDMSGNVAEWVNTGKQGPYVYGGSWQNGKDESRCDSRIQLQNGRKYFYVGFRCCK
jgi:formylglycine-generating enzyme required for sulfatase activity